MKKIISMIAAALCMASCSDMLDIVPKGKTTLEKTTDLEMLLTQEWTINASYYDDLMLICNASLGGQTKSVAEMLAQPNTLEYAYLAYDESIDRAAITPSDTRYEEMYKYINYMNTVISKMPEASGDESRKPALVAEARVMRAWLHFLCAAIYARQYNAETASTEGGIAYVTSTEVTEQKQKLTLAETYRCILDDCADEVIALLPADHGAQVMRGDRAWGNAVRAVVLFQMKRYTEALPYAEEAIRLRPQMFDRSVIKETGEWTQDETSDNNLLYIGGSARVAPTMEMLTLEAAQLFEAGDYVINYEATGWNLSYGQMFSGIDGVRMFMGWGTSCNVYGLTSEQLHYVAAECLIRTGHIDEGLAQVNAVRKLRVEDSQPFTASTEQQAMALLQQAKFIECLSTPFNFMDRKRWNTETAYRHAVTHRLGTLGTYTLQPESPLWVQPFPVNAVRYNPTLTQNY